ncbi:EAL domain-containing protein [Accumulibacter sp.]|nr:EAL domain-containing protein [Accumulibacter sp.]
MQTVAEGIESEAQLAFLRDKGGDAGQGYLFARALPAAEFEALVRDRHLV